MNVLNLLICCTLILLVAISSNTNAFEQVSAIRAKPRPPPRNGGGGGKGGGGKGGGGKGGGGKGGGQGGSSTGGGSDPAIPRTIEGPIAPPSIAKGSSAEGPNPPPRSKGRSGPSTPVPVEGPTPPPRSKGISGPSTPVPVKGPTPPPRSKGKSDLSTPVPVESPIPPPRSYKGAIPPTPPPRSHRGALNTGITTIILNNPTVKQKQESQLQGQLQPQQTTGADNKNTDLSSVTDEGAVTDIPTGDAPSGGVLATVKDQTKSMAESFLRGAAEVHDTVLNTAGRELAGKALDKLGLGTTYSPYGSLDGYNNYPSVKRSGSYSDYDSNTDTIGSGLEVPSVGSESTDTSAQASETTDTDTQASENIDTGAQANEGIDTGAQASEGIDTGAQASEGIDTGAQASEGIDTGAQGSEGIDTGAQPSESTDTGAQASENISADGGGSAATESGNASSATDNLTK